ncbi:MULTISPECIES: ABC transporter ATP-binding protein [unclassified Pseudofrankia]|uniref:ABC transporter ATP-binding protein n=1 Tax=unclassified Pseudofrankia TaxID=2994372 RepID=UPI0008DAB951|nr:MULTISPECIES: ATP-binding cassette domain-containing protein [unclassified Pseudofrankia]MDT3444643.1 ATP-binding cassette domain-containing protein [Pseudofrankia sp. BMG5.37]OHV47411.1 ABC transporter ATP-binding protein [Pseudofrankia sp. BMG5.36]
MLRLDGVRLVHNPGTPTEVVALDHVDLEIPAGQFVTVVGSNGAGKSSLVGVVAGAHRPSRGRVLLDGRDVTRLPDHARAAAVARVFDDPLAGTAPELSLADNLALAGARGRRRRLLPAITRGRRAAMRDDLAMLGLGLERRLADPVALLSAGQRQSVTMLMAGLRQPRLLLLDEHLAALDPRTRDRVLDLTVRTHQRLGCASLMITHSMRHAIEVGDRLLVMARGGVVYDVAGQRKAALTPAGLVDIISGLGDAPSDRQLLAG